MTITTFKNNVYRAVHLSSSWLDYVVLMGSYDINDSADGHYISYSKNRGLTFRSKPDYDGVISHLIVHLVHPVA